MPNRVSNNKAFTRFPLANSSLTRALYPPSPRPHPANNTKKQIKQRRIIIFNSETRPANHYSWRRQYNFALPPSTLRYPAPLPSQKNHSAPAAPTQSLPSHPPSATTHNSRHRSPPPASIHKNSRPPADPARHPHQNPPARSRTPAKTAPPPVTAS